MKRLVFGLLALIAIPLGLSCNSPETPQCVPGQSIACAGEMGCNGFQVCNADGSAFGACSCGDVTTSSSASGSTNTAMASSSISSSSSVGGAGSSGSSASVGGSGGAGGGAPFSPADLPGLSLWLETDVGLVPNPQKPGYILKWQDQSPHHHLATATADMTLDPVAANGHDAIICYDAAFSIPDHPSLRFGTGDFLVAMVVNGPVISSQTHPRLFMKSYQMVLEAPSVWLLSFSLDGGVVAASAPPPADSLHVVVFGRNAGTLFMNVDDATSTITTPLVDADKVGENVGFCDRAGNGPIHMTALLAVKGPTTASNAAALTAYLETTYGL